MNKEQIIKMMEQKKSELLEKVCDAKRNLAIFRRELYYQEDLRAQRQAKAGTLDRVAWKKRILEQMKETNSP